MSEPADGAADLKCVELWTQGWRGRPACSFGGSRTGVGGNARAGASFFSLRGSSAGEAGFTEGFTELGGLGGTAKGAIGMYLGK